MKRYPLYPVVDGALVDVNLMFGVDITRPRFPTAEDREIAERFDIQAAIDKAEKEIKERGLDGKAADC